jgi:hypothetical protein
MSDAAKCWATRVETNADTVSFVEVRKPCGGEQRRRSYRGCTCGCVLHQSEAEGVSKDLLAEVVFCEGGTVKTHHVSLFLA